MDIKEFEELYKIAFPEFSNFKPLPHLAHLEGARWGFLTSKKLLLSRIKELEEVEQERERLSKLLIEARVEIVRLRIGIKEVLEWRNFDGDGISDPLRKELYKLVEEKGGEYETSY